MKKIFSLLLILLFPILIIYSMMNLAHSETLQTVASVDINRYMGKWYEISSFPQRFQKGCHCTVAEYVMTDKGYVQVINRCNKDSVNGKESSIKGKAFIVKGSNNAKLNVQFFWPFKGKYWIIELADDYSFAVVSHPNLKYLWILSRTPTMDEKTYNGILERLKIKGLDISKLKKTIQQCYDKAVVEL